jgi:hypothetical protein
MSQDIETAVRSEVWFNTDRDSIEYYDEEEERITVHVPCLIAEDITKIRASESFELRGIHGRYDGADDDVNMVVSPLE